jgi:2-keto-3-deoxy-L-rhamnonate aldolase RhmA
MNKKNLIGTFTLNTCPNVTEIISKNMDFVIIDREHGPHDFSGANILNKIIKKNSFSFIRASHLNRIEIQRCLDLNPDGILIPQISSFKDAKLALSYSYFNPKGTRGLSPYTGSFDYNHHNSDNKKKLINNKIFLGLLIEGSSGLASLNQICLSFHKEISLIYFGLYDFTSSLGLKPDWKDKRVKEAVKKIVNVCKKKGIRVGSIARNLNEIKFLKKMGINFICYQNDTGIIHEAFNLIKNKR